MKNFFGILLAILLIFSANSASAFVLDLNNWGFNPSGAYSSSIWDGTYQYTEDTDLDETDDLILGETILIDEITILGNGLINATSINTFAEFGTFEATGFQNDDAAISNDQTGLGMFGSNGYELTFMLTDVTGSFYTTDSGVNQLIFDSAELDVYIHNANNYGSTNGIYGANDGIQIAAFTLSNGAGSINWGKSPADGSTDLTFLADVGSDTMTGLTHGLLPGVWFDENGVDLSTYAADLLVLGMTDSNNMVINDVSGNLFSEYDGQGGLVAGNNAPSKFFVRSDGSFDLAVVPEPGTLILLGFGLIGLAGVGRRRKKD